MRLIRITGATVLLLAVMLDFVPLSAQAGFQQAFLRLDRMKISTATGGTVCAQASATGPTEAKVVVTFPTTYTLSTTAANWTVTTTNLPSGASAWPGIGTATNADNSAKTVTFPSSDITSSSTLYCFNFSKVHHINFTHQMPYHCKIVRNKNHRNLGFFLNFFE
jgi:hypothetical protein